MSNAYPRPDTHGPDRETEIRHRRLTIQRTDGVYVVRHDDGRTWTRATLAECYALDPVPVAPEPPRKSAPPASPFLRMRRTRRPRAGA